jgi:hypothetical protein
MTPPPEHVSVALPVGWAIERVKRVLFEPFDLGKWFTIGFCAWLAQLGQGGSGAHFNLGPEHHGGTTSLRDELERAWDYVANNLHWILPLVAVVLLLGLAVWVLLIWLSSRGRFMFLHCVALDKAEVAVPWRKFAREANSLFRFRLVVALVGMVVVLPLVVVMAVSAWRMIERGEPSVSGILELVGAGLLLLLLTVVFWVVKRLATDFVVPIMFRRGGTCLQGWAVLLGLLAGNLGRFILYFLFQIVLALATGVLVLTAFLVTCCIFCCLAALPYLGTVLLLPIFVFRRAYSLFYLAQYGEDYDVFRAVHTAPVETSAR